MLPSLLLDQQAVARGAGILRRENLNLLGRRFGHLLRGLGALRRRNRLSARSYHAAGAGGTAGIATTATVVAAAIAMEQATDLVQEPVSAARIAAVVIVAAGVATAVAMEQATRAATATPAAPAVTAAIAGRFAAVVAMEPAANLVEEAMAATAIVVAAAAAVIAAAVITAATMRIRGRRRWGSRLGCGRWRIGAREPGRRYQQESSIHDCTSLWDFSAQGRGRWG
jgi:hypothetical protein